MEEERAERKPEGEQELSRRTSQGGQSGWKELHVPRPQGRTAHTSFEELKENQWVGGQRAWLAYTNVTGSLP